MVLAAIFVIGSIAHTAGSGKPAKSPAAVTSSASPARTRPDVSTDAAAASRAATATAAATAAAAKARPVIPAAAVQAAGEPAPPPPGLTAATGCYPVTSQGSCYEPGEYCQGIDHGTAGVAGDGTVIDCRDSDGWHWEPA